jgi:hypothetical protein
MGMTPLGYKTKDFSFNSRIGAHFATRGSIAKNAEAVDFLR